MSAAVDYLESVQVPRALRWPVELLPPEGFDAERLDTWPPVIGRLEYCDGRLLYMPPCGDTQQDTVTDLVITLGAWIRTHPDFVLGTNEAGMRLGGATRAADAAIWRRTDVRGYSGGLRRAPPVLAVEVAGRDEGETLLRDKASWYLTVGTATVWLVLPDAREVVVVTASGAQRFGGAEALPEPADLEGLRVPVSELFQQLDAAL